MTTRLCSTGKKKKITASALSEVLSWSPEAFSFLRSWKDYMRFGMGENEQEQGEDGDNADEKNGHRHLSRL